MNELTETEIAQLEQMERERQEQKKSVYSASNLNDKHELHVRLMEEFPLPWTIENLGPVNYAIVARRGKFFDPLGPGRKTYRPVLDPFLPPGHPILVERANSDRVKIAQEIYAAVTKQGRKPQRRTVF